MRYYRKKKIIIISCLAALVLSIGLGFAAFSTNLKINGSANVSPTDANFKVIFTDTASSGGVYTQLPVIPTSNPSDLEKNDGEIATEGTKISNIGGVFTEDGQSITYDFFVYNVGKYDAYLTNIDYTYKEGTYSKRTCTNNGASDETFSEACNDIIIKVVLAGETYTGNTIFTDHVLAKGEYEPIQVIIEYPEGSDLPDGEMDIEFSDIELIFGTIDEAHPLPDAALMANPSNVFRFSGITRDQVESIETVDSIDVPYDAIDSCDASAKEDESVIAWYKDEDNNGLYELYIGGEGIIKVTSGEKLFKDYNKAKIINLSYFDTSDVINMYEMFANDSSLKTLLIDNFDGSSVQTMERTFYGISVDELVLNDFYAPNLYEIKGMFQKARMKKLEMNNFTGGLVTQSYEWKASGNLDALGFTNTTEISLKNLRLPNVTNVGNMFSNLPELTVLDISGIDIPNAQIMTGMFSNNTKLTKIIGIEDLKTNKATRMDNMFSKNPRLEHVDVSNFSTSNVVNMENMFAKCYQMRNLDLNNFDTSKVINMDTMFDDDYNLGTLLIDNFDGSSVQTMNHTFHNIDIDELILNDFNAPNLYDINGMFQFARMKKLEMNNFTAGKVTSTWLWKSYGNYAEPGFTNTTEMSIKNLNLPNVTNATHMFADMKSLVKLDISGLNMPKVENISELFNSSSNLSEIDLTAFDFSKITSSTNMLKNIPVNISIKISDTQANRNFMNVNFNSYTNITWI